VLRVLGIGRAGLSRNGLQRYVGSVRPLPAAVAIASSRSKTAAIPVVLPTSAAVLALPAATSAATAHDHRLFALTCP